jgi:hypothetical protein
MISLVRLSGGIDSTYALHKVLSETDDEVLVHHVHLLTDAGRYIPEAEACRRVVEYCRSRHRPFHFSESTIDHRRFVAVGVDIIAVGLEAGMVASSYAIATRRKKFIDRWILGVSADDTIPEFRISEASSVARSNCITREERKPNLFIFPRISLRDQVSFLPRELVDLTWSCRFPRGLSSSPRPCGNCISCKRRTSALAGQGADAN